jgi:transcriptional regulator with XRE-family HTH domain
MLGLRAIGEGRVDESGGSVPIPRRVFDGDVAGWLRDVMAERGMTCRELARRSGIDQSTISRLLHGERRPKWDTVVTLLRALATDASPPLTSQTARRSA